MREESTFEPGSLQWEREAGRGQEGPAGEGTGRPRPATGSHPGASAHSSYFSVQ